MAIAEGNNLTRLSDALAVERDEFVYRCYIALGQFNLVLGQIKDSAPQTLLAVKLLAQYMSNPSNSAEAVKSQLGAWIQDGACPPSIRLIAAIVYDKEDQVKEAFMALGTPTTMEQMAFYAQLCLKIARSDLAEKQLDKLTKFDEDASLTQLVSAWVNLARGGKKIQEACYAYEELIDKFEPSLLLLNGLAACNMHLRKFDEAETHLLAALQKGQNDADTLINIIACYHHMGKAPDVVERYSLQLFDAHPNHPYVKKMKRVEAQFDRVAAQMAVA